jgi:hypothetical protein
MVDVSANAKRWMHHPSWNGLHVLPEPEDMPYTGPDLWDVAPPGVHALLAVRAIHVRIGLEEGK